MSVAQVLDQGRAALLGALAAIDELEAGGTTVLQLALVRMVVTEIRRSTLVLQKLSSRVDGFDEWYAPRRTALAADPLMGYFRDLRNEIQKEGLPGAMAEIVERTTGTTIGDVAVYEDRHGIAVSGAMRPDALFEPGEIPDASERIELRNFRLPDPPSHHRGEPLTDLRFSSLARLAVDFLLGEVIDPADRTFRPKVRAIAAKGDDDGGDEADADPGSERGDASGR
jgi:hypothetical protein